MAPAVGLEPNVFTREGLLKVPKKCHFSAQMKKQSWPKITAGKYSTGATFYMVDTRAFNELRPKFKTKKEAEAHADAIRVERKNSGLSAGMISDKLRVEVLECVAFPLFPTHHFIIWTHFQNQLLL
jgi:hypothetical protein